MQRFPAATRPPDSDAQAAGSLLKRIRAKASWGSPSLRETSKNRPSENRPKIDFWLCPAPKERQRSDPEPGSEEGR
jgi:hypothetical protein